MSVDAKYGDWNYTGKQSSHSGFPKKEIGKQNNNLKQINT